MYNDGSLVRPENILADLKEERNFLKNELLKKDNIPEQIAHLIVAIGRFNEEIRSFMKKDEGVKKNEQ